MSLHKRIEKLEQAMLRPSDEDRFHKLVNGEYDHSISLRENFLRAELPPGAMPSVCDERNDHEKE